MLNLNDIVINPSARTGARATLFHQVALGVAGVFGKDDAPQIASGIVLGAGTKMLGLVKIGEGPTIGPNFVVTKDVLACFTVVETDRLVSMHE